MFASIPIWIASERMENGNIMEFIKAHRDYNRLRLVSEGCVATFCRIDNVGQLIDTVTGLEYLHEHDIVHGDLKGVSS